MIYWGTSIDPLGKCTSLNIESCKICKKDVKLQINGEQGYFTLYGLPLGPVSKKYYTVCPECDTRLKIGNSDSKLSLAKQQLVGKMKFKYVWGWLILLPVLYFIYYLYTLVK